MLLNTIIEIEETATGYYDFWTAILPIVSIIVFLSIIGAIIFSIVYLFKRLSRVIKNQEKLIGLLKEDKGNL